MTISDSDRIINEIEGAGFIEVKFEQIVMARYIGFDILEPRLPTDHPPAACWAADNIEVGPADWEFGGKIGLQLAPTRAERRREGKEGLTLTELPSVARSRPDSSHSSISG